MRRWMALALALATLLLAVGAAAAPPVVLRPASGAAPAKMALEDGDWVAHFVVENRGTDPVQVEQLTLIEGDEKDPRLPRGMKVQFADGSPAARIEPGQAKEAIVRWSPPKGWSVPEIYGHVVASMEGHADVALGFAGVLHGQTGGQNPLLWLVLLPLLGAVAVSVARSKGKQLTRQLVLVVAAVQLAIALWLATRFDPQLTRFDGASGYQWIERVLLSRSWGIEYAIGVDGLSLSWLVALPLAVLSALGLEKGSQRPVPWAALLALDAALSFGVVSLDLSLWLASWLVAVVMAVLALRASDVAAARRAAVALGLGLGLVAVAVVVLSGHVGSLWLLDGSQATRSFSLLDLSHARVGAGGELLFGLNPVQVIFPLFLLGSLLLLAAAPFHGWLTGAVRDAPAPVASMLAGALTSAAGYGLLRVTYTAMPQGVQWAAPATCGLGAVVVLCGSLAAWVRKDARLLAADGIASQGGFVLLAVGGLTAMGVQGAIVLLAGRVLIAPILLGVARGRVLAVARGVGLSATVALPGTVGFLGVALVALGTLARQPGFVIAALLAMIPLGATLVKMFEGRTSDAQVPDKDSAGSIGFAAVLVLVLGLWPHPWLVRVDSGALDLAARVNPPGLLEVV